MTTKAEPEWDEETRDLALGLTAVNLCPNCGGPAYLCQDPENQDRFEVPPPIRCHRLTALAEAQKPFTEQTNPHVHALIWRTVFNPGAR